MKITLQLILLFALCFPLNIQAQDYNEYIAFHSDRDGDDEIYMMNPDGSNVTKLTSNRIDDGWVGISGDGRYIAYETYPTDDFNDVEVAVVDVNTLEVTQITDNAYFDGEPTFYYDADMLSDGTQIIVYETRPASGSEIRWILLTPDAEPDGSPREALTSVPDTQIGWPDIYGENGAIAVLERDLSDDDLELMVYLNDDSIQLTDDFYEYNEPQWSPDGQYLVYAAEDRNDDYDIYIMSVKTGDTCKVLENNADEKRPDWSPDGTKLVFASDRDADFEIYTINTDGSDMVKLTNNSAGDYQPRWWGDYNPNIQVNPGCLEDISAPILEQCDLSAIMVDYYSMQYTDAIEAFSEIIEDNPKCAEAYLYNGMAQVASEGRSACLTAIDLWADYRQLKPDGALITDIIDGDPISSGSYLTCETQCKRTSDCRIVR